MTSQQNISAGTTRASGTWRAWLNSNRLVILVAWAVSTALLFAWLPPLAQPLTAIAALAAAIAARDRILTVFFGVITIGVVAVVLLFHT